MKDWLEGLAPRDRRALLSAAVVLGLLLFWLLVWQPLGARHAELTDEVANGSADLDWMRSAVLEVRMLQSAGQQPAKDERTLIARVTAELGSDKLEASELRPEGENRLRLTLLGIPFSHLLQPLVRLQTGFGVQVREAVVERGSGSGIVDVRLLLQRGDD